MKRFFYLNKILYMIKPLFVTQQMKILKDYSQISLKQSISSLSTTLIIYIYNIKHITSVMSKWNRVELPFYQSQASTRNCQPLSPSHKLYTSRAQQQSPIYLNNLQNNNKSPKQEKYKYQKVIDSLSNQSNTKKYDLKGQNLLNRNKSVESIRWQSPSKGCSKIETYASIIQEINQHNDKALQQLDEDLKRIKNNLTKVKQEVVVDKSFTQTEALYEEIELLQEQNQRLRQKNLHLLDEKKKLMQTLEQYESLYQREKAKQTATLALKQIKQEKSGEQGAFMLKLKTEVEEKLKQKTQQCQQLKKQVESLTKVKNISDKAKTFYTEEKNKFIDKIAELQKEIGGLTLKFEDNIKLQLQKKDKYFLNLLQTEKAKNDALLKKAKISNRESLQVDVEQKINQNNEINKKLEVQITHFRQKEDEAKRQIQRINQILKKSEQKIQILNNEIQFLTFAHKQASERISEKDQQLKNVRQKLNICQNELKNSQNQCSALNIRCQQQKHRYILLQQLYHRMQKQSESIESISQEHLNNYKKTMQDIQKQVNNSKFKLRDKIEENKQLEKKISDLSIDNQKLAFQIRIKNQEIVSLKSINIALNNQKKQQKVPNYVSPPKYINRQRVLSGQPRISNNQVREKEHFHQYSKIRGMQKQLQMLINECKIQRQRQKNIYNEKERKFKQTVEGQKKKTEDLSLKMEELKKNCDNVVMQKLVREEELLDTIRKKESQIVAHQTKLNEMSLIINRLQFQKTNLKASAQMKLIQIKQENISKNSENSQVKEIKQQFLYFVESILREIKIMSNNFKEQKYDKKQIFLKEIGLFNSLKDIRLFAQFNFAIKMLSQHVNGMAKRNLQLQKQNKQKQFNEINELRSNISQKYPKSNRISLVNFGKKSIVQESQRFHVQQMQTRLKFQLQKYSELQFNYQQKCKSYSKLSNELQEQFRQIRQLKKQIIQLKQDKQQLEEKNRKQQRKINQQEDQLLSKSNKLEKLSGREKQREIMNSYIPCNDNPHSIYNEVDSYGLYEARMRSRVRSVRHASPFQKRNVEDVNKWQEQVKIAQLEQINNNFKKQLQAKAGQINALRKEKNEWQTKEKKYQEAFQLKENEIKIFQKNIDDLKKKKVSLESKIKKLQNELKVLVKQVENLNQKIEQICTDKNHNEQFQEKTIRDLHMQKDILERKIKKQLTEKDSRLINLSQKHEIKILQLHSQINNLKEKISGNAIQHQTLINKNQKIIYQNSKLAQKIAQYQQNIKVLKSKLQNQQKQRQKLIQVFKTNTNKLTKMLQQKQIEIQQLKFIQESTIINNQYSKNQLSNKKQSDSAYSFRYEE